MRRLNRVELSAAVVIVGAASALLVLVMLLAWFVMTEFA
jgi:hypothetical protein